MLLSKSCVYGVRALIYLAIEDQRRYIPIKEVSEKLNISFHFLTKILQTLTQHNLIESFKGPKGGVTLARNATDISILDVVEAIDGKKIFQECLLGLPGCSIEKPCPLHSMWGQTREELRRNLSASRLSELAGEINAGNLRLYDVVVNGTLKNT